VGLSVETVAWLTDHSGWRLLMLCGALPALLTFFIRLFVPESERWLEERSRGATRQWSSRDLLAVLVGTVAALGMIAIWAAGTPLVIAWPVAVKVENPLPVQIAVTIAGLVIAYFGFTYPARKYLERWHAQAAPAGNEWTTKRIIGRMLIGATLSGTALLGTWASIQNAPSWAGSLAQQAAENRGETNPDAIRSAAGSARATTQIASGAGAILGTIAAALLGSWIGRRLSYLLLCIGSLAISLLFFRTNTEFNTTFVVMAFLAGGLTASFYGWLPLYLPELFPTRVRAFGQGFTYNFGRILAAVGALQFGYLMNNVFNGSYPQACTVLSFVYVVGMFVIWLAPETHQQPLPE
jgi:MFS family permease